MNQKSAIRKTNLSFQWVIFCGTNNCEGKTQKTKVCNKLGVLSEQLLSIHSPYASIGLVFLDCASGTSAQLRGIQHSRCLAVLMASTPPVSSLCLGFLNVFFPWFALPPPASYLHFIFIFLSLHWEVPLSKSLLSLFMFIATGVIASQM